MVLCKSYSRRQNQLQSGRRRELFGLLKHPQLRVEVNLEITKETKIEMLSFYSTFTHRGEVLL